MLAARLGQDPRRRPSLVGEIAAVLACRPRWPSPRPGRPPGHIPASALAAELRKSLPVWTAGKRRSGRQRAYFLLLVLSAALSRRGPHVPPAGPAPRRCRHRARGGQPGRHGRARGSRVLHELGRAHMLGEHVPGPVRLPRAGPRLRGGQARAADRRPTAGPRPAGCSTTTCTPRMPRRSSSTVHASRSRSALPRPVGFRPNL